MTGNCQKRKNKEKNIKKKKISFSERISKLTNKTSWSELSCIINKTDPVASVRKKRKKQQCGQTGDYRS